MGNICELLINVVKWNKPKVLTGLNQKVRGTVRVFYIHSAQSTIPRRTSRPYPIGLPERNMVSPIISTRMWKATRKGSRQVSG